MEHQMSETLLNFLIFTLTGMTIYLLWLVIADKPVWQPRQKVTRAWTCTCEDCGAEFLAATAWDCATAYTRHYYAHHETVRAR